MLKELNDSNGVPVFVLYYFESLHRKMWIFNNRNSMNKFITKSKLFNYSVEVINIDIENIKELLNEIK